MHNTKWFSLYGALAIVWSAVGIPLVFFCFSIVYTSDFYSSDFISFLLAVAIFYYGVLFSLLKSHKSAKGKTLSWYRYVTIIASIITTMVAVVLIFNSLQYMGVRDPGRDSSVKQSINNMRSQAEIYYNTNDFSYKGVCEDEKLIMLVKAVESNGATNYHCESEDSSYKIWTLLPKTQEYFCIDSTGFVGQCDPADFNNSL